MCDEKCFSKCAIMESNNESLRSAVDGLMVLVEYYKKANQILTQRLELYEKHEEIRNVILMGGQPS